MIDPARGHVLARQLAEPRHQRSAGSSGTADARKTAVWQSLVIASPGRLSIPACVHRDLGTSQTGNAFRDARRFRETRGTFSPDLGRTSPGAAATTSADARADSANVLGDEHGRSRKSDQPPLAGTQQNPRRSRRRGHLQQETLWGPVEDHPPDVPCGTVRWSRESAEPPDDPRRGADAPRDESTHRTARPTTSGRPARRAAQDRARHSSRNSLPPGPASAPSRKRRSTTPAAAGAAGRAAMTWTLSSFGFSGDGRNWLFGRIRKQVRGMNSHPQLCLCIGLNQPHQGDSERGARFFSTFRAAPPPAPACGNSPPDRCYAIRRHPSRRRRLASRPPSRRNRAAYGAILLETVAFQRGFLRTGKTSSPQAGAALENRRQNGRGSLLFRCGAGHNSARSTLRRVPSARCRAAGRTQ